MGPASAYDKCAHGIACLPSRQGGPLHSLPVTKSLSLQLPPDAQGTLLKIHNWVMASVPRHPVLSRVIHESRAFVTWEFFSLAKE